MDVLLRSYQSRASLDGGWQHALLTDTLFHLIAFPRTQVVIFLFCVSVNFYYRFLLSACVCL